MIKVRFYFPDTSRIKDRNDLVDILMWTMRKDGGIKYAGYLREQELRKDLLRHIGTRGLFRYEPLSAGKKRIMDRDIRAAVKKCQTTLPHPDLPIFVFVYPWFPSRSERAKFEGISALAAYYTIHLFIEPDSYTRLSLKKTIAHEWSHLVFYRYNPKHRYTLGEHILMEE